MKLARIVTKILHSRGLLGHCLLWPWTLIFWPQNLTSTSINPNTPVTKIGWTCPHWFSRYDVQKVFWDAQTHSCTYRLTHGRTDLNTQCFRHRFTAQRSCASAVLGIVILCVCLSVCSSVTRVFCDKTKQCTADILIPPNGQSSFLTSTASVWWATPFPSEICAQNDPTPSKNADFDKFPLITSQP